MLGGQMSVAKLERSEEAVVSGFGMVACMKNVAKVRPRMLKMKGEYSSNAAIRGIEKQIEEQSRVSQTIINQLQALSEDTNMPITQENGQRCFGPPRDWNGPPPPKGCEVFVGKLPRDVFEPHLYEIFSRIGQIYELRVMMDFSGTNRGYCFVQYTQIRDAQAAIRELNEFEISPGRSIGVMKSIDNCRLYIKGIPQHKTEEEVFQEISRLTPGVRKAIVVQSIQNKDLNQGFAFVEYSCHKTAVMARKTLIPGNITLWGQDVAVDWADEEVENQIKTLCVKNISHNTPTGTLVKHFNEVSNGGVEHVKKIDNYAFLTFTSHEQANAARQALDRTEIDGSQVKVYWGKQLIENKGGRDDLMGNSTRIRMNMSEVQGSKRAFNSNDLSHGFMRVKPTARRRVSDSEQFIARHGQSGIIPHLGYGNYFQQNGFCMPPEFIRNNSESGLPVASSFGPFANAVYSPPGVKTRHMSSPAI